MELLRRSHSNLKEFDKFLESLLDHSDDTIALLENYKGIRIFVPEELTIFKTVGRRNESLPWIDFKEGISAFWSRKLNRTAPTKYMPNSKLTKSGLFGLNVNLTKMLDDDSKWSLLYAHLGPDIMNKILTNCQLFLPLSESSYFALDYEKSTRKLKELETRSHFSRNRLNGPKTLDLGPILYGKKRLFSKPVGDDVYNDTDVCDRLVRDILEQDVGSRVNISLEANHCFRRTIMSFVRKCSKTEKCKLILRNLFDRLCAQDRKEGRETIVSVKNEPLKLKMAGKCKSSCVIRGRSRKRKSKKCTTLKEIPLKYVKKFILFHFSKIIPENMFGRQKRQIIRKVISVLKYGKNQCFLLDEILENINIGKIPCVKSCETLNIQTNLFAKLIAWLFKNWIFTLIGSNFYVTEKQNCFLKLFFYKATLFKRLTFRTIKSLQNRNILKPINSKEIISKQAEINRSPSLFRLIPKGNNGVRPVIWSKVKNDYIDESLHFFRQLALTRAPNYSSNTKNNFNQCLTNLCSKWNEAGRPPLFYVKIDITDAYGSVILKKLVGIVRDLTKKSLKTITSVTYRKFKCFTSQGDKCKCYHIWRFEELPPNVPGNSVIVPTPEFKIFEVQKLLSMAAIECLLKMLKIGNDNYLITKGLPQAGKLSACFCQIYYDEFDEKYLDEFRKNENELFFRAVDDYLFVSSSLERAKIFLQSMESGNTEFGISINKKKTLTNFGDNSSAVIPFYGYLIDTKALEISGNFKIYAGIGIFQTMTFKSRSNPGNLLKVRMTNINCLKLDKIILNPKVNGKSSILLGVFRAATLMSFRFNAIVSNFFKQLNAHFLVSCISICANCIASRVSRLTIIKTGEPAIVSYEEARCMVLEAFITNLSRNCCYIDVLSILKLQLRNVSSKLTRYKKKYIQKVIDSNKPDPFKGTY